MTEMANFIENQSVSQINLMHFLHLSLFALIYAKLKFELHEFVNCDFKKEELFCEIFVVQMKV